MWNDLLGKPFKNGARGPEAFDCWGLVQYIYREKFGTLLPDYHINCKNTPGIFRAYLRDREQYPLITAKEKPAPCLVLMRFNSRCVNHIGIYIGAGRFIHIHEGAGVCIGEVAAPEWRHAIVEYRDVTGPPGPIAKDGR